MAINKEEGVKKRAACFICIQCVNVEILLTSRCFGLSGGTAALPCLHSVCGYVELAVQVLAPVSCWFRVATMRVLMNILTLLSSSAQMCGALRSTVV